MIGVFAGLIGLSAIGAILWYFVGHAGSKHISVAVTSTPVGAEVVQGDRILGNAPVVVALPRGEAAITLALRKEGFLTAQRTITPNTDQEIAVRLLPKPVEDTPPPEPPAPTPAPAPEPKAKAPDPEPAPEPVAPKPKRKKKPAVEPLLLTPSF